MTNPLDSSSAYAAAMVSRSSFGKSESSVVTDHVLSSGHASMVQSRPRALSDRSLSNTRLSMTVKLFFDGSRQATAFPVSVNVYQWR